MIPITCPRCSNAGQVPDNRAGKLATCPKCKTSFAIPSPAAPVATVDQPPAQLPLMIEQTSKALKLQMLAGVLVLLFGAIVSQPLVMVAGVVWIVVARGLAWWHHG